jgi:hypothetical protein
LTTIDVCLFGFWGQRKEKMDSKWMWLGAIGFVLSCAILFWVWTQWLWWMSLLTMMMIAIGLVLWFLYQSWKERSRFRKWASSVQRQTKGMVYVTTRPSWLGYRSDQQQWRWTTSVQPQREDPHCRLLIRVPRNCRFRIQSIEPLTTRDELSWLVDLFKSSSSESNISYQFIVKLLHAIDINRVIECWERVPSDSSWSKLSNADHLSHPDHVSCFDSHVFSLSKASLDQHWFVVPSPSSTNSLFPDPRFLVLE